MKRLLAALLAALMLCGCTALPAPVILPQKFTEPTPTTPPLPQSPYSPSDFQYENGLLTCTAGQTVMGIDVSSHQQTIDWQQLASAGVKFAFIRLGYRGLKEGGLHVDEFAERNLAGAKATGIAVGAYFFSQAVSVAEAQEEARFALDILDGFALDLPLVYDWEYVDDTCRTANVAPVTLTQCTKTFCDAVEAAGYKSMIYFNSYQGTQMMKLWELTDYPWWLAMYDVQAEFPCNADLWQYTNKGRLPGIEGDVDINLMFVDFGLGQEVFAEQA